MGGQGDSSIIIIEYPPPTNTFLQTWDTNWTNIFFPKILYLTLNLTLIPWNLVDVIIMY